mmetsp:Transcript_94848/g.239100  ORF Transcript_94848/g.239100 Transcript_94848/m.239100 type:complete len:290 (-) Transcript_94848:18-887(-)
MSRVRAPSCNKLLFTTFQSLPSCKSGVEKVSFSIIPIALVALMKALTFSRSFHGVVQFSFTCGTLPGLMMLAILHKTLPSFNHSKQDRLPRLSFVIASIHCTTSSSRPSTGPAGKSLGVLSCERVPNAGMVFERVRPMGSASSSAHDGQTALGQEVQNFIMRPLLFSSPQTEHWMLATVTWPTSKWHAPPAQKSTVLSSDCKASIPDQITLKRPDNSALSNLLLTSSAVKFLRWRVACMSPDGTLMALRITSLTPQDSSHAVPYRPVAIASVAVKGTRKLRSCNALGLR